MLLIVFLVTVSINTIGLTAGSVETDNENTVRSEFNGPGARMMTNIALVGSDPSSASINRDQSSVVIDPSTLLEKASKDYLLNDIIEDEEDRFITTRSGKLRANLGTGQEADMWADEGPIDQAMNNEKILMRRKRSVYAISGDGTAYGPRLEPGEGIVTKPKRSRTKRVSDHRRARRQKKRARKSARRAARKAARAPSLIVPASVVRVGSMPVDGVSDVDRDPVHMSTYNSESQQVVSRPESFRDEMTRQPSSLSPHDIQKEAIVTPLADIRETKPIETPTGATKASTLSRTSSFFNIQTSSADGSTETKSSFSKTESSDNPNPSMVFSEDSVSTVKAQESDSR